MMTEIATRTSSKVPPMTAHASLLVIGLASISTSLAMEAATPIPVTIARHVDGELWNSLESCTNSLQSHLERGRYIHIYTIYIYIYADTGMIHDLTCDCSFVNTNYGLNPPLFPLIHLGTAEIVAVGLAEKTRLMELASLMAITAE